MISSYARQANSLLAEKQGGEAYLLQKKKDKLSDSLINDVAERMLEECHQRLQPLSDAIESRLVNLMNGRLQALTATVVLRARDFELLEQIVSEIEKGYSQYSASGRLSGPWPAYSAARRVNCQAAED